MSSREVADICGARHNDVVATIERLFENGVLRESRKTTRTYRPEKGGRPTEVYDLTKRDTLVVVSGYNDEVRAKIIDRWMELEDRATVAQTPAVPTSFREALLLAADQQEKIEAQEKALAVVTPKAAALDRISTADGSYGLTEAAKILQIKPKALIAFMATSQWIYRRNGTKNWLAYQGKIDAGYLWHKIGTYTDGNGEEKTRDTVKVLPKGLAKLAQIVPGAKIDPDLMEMEASPFTKKPEPVS
ncbi:hypothetical protein AD943_08680 [Gluconobacter roseus]|nr:hypothetical protein AD943_08680 [Gluconobacter roseus]GBR43402.1 prophage antirepressor [Gluconobacter roseus NBRC 3990]